MRRGQLPVAAATTLSLLILGCARGAGSIRPQIEYGVDACDECRMVISDPTWASVAVNREGRVVRFDDLHCLAGFLAGQRGDWRVWVHVVDTDAWLDASGAWFTRRTERVTPMGSGWTAYARHTAAASGSSAEPLSWGRFRAEAQQDGRGSAPEPGSAGGIQEQESS